MSTELRPSGIDVVGAVPWGTHFCHFYATRDDLLEMLVPYFKAGLENNEFCMWVISELTKQEVCNALKQAVPDFERYLADRSIEIIGDHEWYIDGGEFARDRVISGWSRKLSQALDRGYAGMRLT